MLKHNYVLHQVNITDKKYIDEMCKLLKTTYRDLLSKYFIYQNKTYKSYLKDAIANDKIYAFTCLAGIKKDLAGFILLKKKNEQLFIINIIVIDAYRNKKVGSFMINDSITKLYKQENILKNVGLDVFETNQLAFKWYQKLGFNVTNQCNWYNVPLKTSDSKIYEQKDETQFSFTVDEVGFKQLNNGNTWMGTLIDGKNLILRSELSESNLQLLIEYLKPFKINSMCWVTHKDQPFLMIDRSISMEIPIISLTANF